MYLLKNPDSSKSKDGSLDKKKTLSCIMKVPKVGNWKSDKWVTIYCTTEVTRDNERDFLTE